MEFSKEKTKYEVKFTSAMKKDMKKVEKRHYDLSLFAEIIGKLANALPIDEKYHDHELEGNCRIFFPARLFFPETCCDFHASW